MTSIVAYSLPSGYLCPICAGARFSERVGYGDVATDNCEALDENSIPIDYQDNEGGYLYPVWNTDRLPKDISCSDCKSIIAIEP